MKSAVCSIVLLIVLYSVAMNCAVPTIVKDVPSPEFAVDDNGSEQNGKRAVRQVGVQVGPIGVGVGPFGGVGVRIGRWFNVAVPPRYPPPIPVAYPVPVAYQPTIPIAYQQTVPIAYQQTVPISYQQTAPVAYQPVASKEYSYSSDYHYNYSY